ncbi:hypothetical protein CPC08DRAFT_752751 [Agrocybe pediades]|nr:hypothetical protein CPC08DRAFT_752751 [Agrocybe pediades]
MVITREAVSNESQVGPHARCLTYINLEEREYIKQGILQMCSLEPALDERDKHASNRKTFVSFNVVLLNEARVGGRIGDSVVKSPIQVLNYDFSSTTASLGNASILSAYKIRPSTVTNGRRTNYNMGRTRTHEVGLWLRLFHMFEMGLGFVFLRSCAWIRRMPEGEAQLSWRWAGPNQNIVNYSYDAGMDSFYEGSGDVDYIDVGVCDDSDRESDGVRGGLFDGVLGDYNDSRNLRIDGVTMTSRVVSTLTPASASDSHLSAMRAVPVRVQPPPAPGLLLRLRRHRLWSNWVLSIRRLESSVKLRTKHRMKLSTRGGDTQWALNEALKTGGCKETVMKWTTRLQNGVVLPYVLLREILILEGELILFIIGWSTLMDLFPNAKKLKECMKSCSDAGESLSLNAIHSELPVVLYNPLDLFGSPRTTILQTRRCTLCFTVTCISQCTRGFSKLFGRAWMSHQSQHMITIR